MSAQNGKVTIQASTILFKAVQRSSDTRFEAAAPTMPLGMVCVGEKGMP